MSYAFDTSSLMAVLLDEGTPGVDVLFDEHTLELTFYEAGNVIWKTTQLQNQVDATETAQLITLLQDLRRELVVHDLSKLGMERVLQTGTEYDLTFYDAAHLVCADVVDATLVTEDSELREVAEDSVSVRDLEDVS